MTDTWRISFESLKSDFEAGAKRHPKLFHALAMSAMTNEVHIYPTPRHEWEAFWMSSVGTDSVPVHLGAREFFGSRGAVPVQRWCVFAREQFGAMLEAFATASFDELAQPNWKEQLVDKPLSSAWSDFQSLANTAGRCLLTLPTHLRPVYPRISTSASDGDASWLWLN